ncbi:MAG: glycosyltransferase family 4 protein [Bacteroidetes bacterium]|nr:glycosyltransferase family 4 protein [Bacteroidota bacterium]
MNSVLYTALTGIPSKHGGGGKRIIHDLMLHLDRDRFRSAFCSFTGYTETVPEDTGLTAGGNMPEHWMRRLPFHDAVTRSNLYQYLYAYRLRRQFRAAAARYHVDILHAHHPYPTPFFIDAGTRTVLSIHSKGGMANEMAHSGMEGYQNNPVFREIARMERYAVAHADAVTFPSHTSRDLFLRMNPSIPGAERMEVIHNGIDVDSVAAVPRSPEVLVRYDIRTDAQLTLLNIADHNAQKNIPLLITALERIVRVHGNDAMLINAGEGQETPRLREQVRTAGLERHVRFLGRIPNEDILRLLKSTDCFVLTSRDVVFDLVVLEALAAETAVFVSDDGGNREIITHGSNGYLLGNDADEIARMIIGADRDRVRSHALRSVQPFTVRSMVRSYETLYERLLSAGVKGGA